MKNKYSDPDGSELVHFKPSTSRLRLYMIKQEGDRASFDVIGALTDISITLKMAGKSKKELLALASDGWDMASIAYVFPSEKKQ